VEFEAVHFYYLNLMKNIAEQATAARIEAYIGTTR
jgi:hypothetical protein